MRKGSAASFGAEVRKYLLRDGFGRKYANRAARELNDHWQELFDESVRTGLTESEAVLQAQKLLGEPEALAHEIGIRMQRLSWLGRAPTLGFATLAITLTILWWVGLGSAAAAISGLFTADSHISGKTPNISLFRIWIDWIRSVGYVAVPWLCCFIAGRLYCGWRPALWACLILAIHNSLNFIRITGSGPHGNVAIGYSFNVANMPDLVPMLAPVAVFLIYQLWRARSYQTPEDLTPQSC